MRNFFQTGGLLLAAMCSVQYASAQVAPHGASNESREVTEAVMQPSNTDIRGLDPATLNPMQKSLQALMSWVDLNADMAGALQRCDKTETTFVEGCAELVLRNWHKVTGLPAFDEMEKDGTVHEIPHIREVVRSAWSKQRAIAYMQQAKNPRPCDELIQHERDSQIWKICQRHENEDTGFAAGQSVSSDGRIEIK